VVAVQANSTAEPVLAKIQKIAPLFKDLVLGDQGEVAVICFDHRIQMLQDFTGDTGKLDAAFKKLKAGSSKQSHGGRGRGSHQHAAPQASERRAFCCSSARRAT